MFDHPKERFKRLWPGVDKADSENIEAPGAGNVSVGIGFWRAHVHENELRIGEATFQVVHGPQQVRICIVHRSFSRECERDEGGAPSVPQQVDEVRDNVNSVGRLAHGQLHFRRPVLPLCFNPGYVHPAIQGAIDVHV